MRTSTRARNAAPTPIGFRAVGAGLRPSRGLAGEWPTGLRHGARVGLTGVCGDWVFVRDGDKLYPPPLTAVVTSPGRDAPGPFAGDPIRRPPERGPRERGTRGTRPAFPPLDQRNTATEVASCLTPQGGRFVRPWPLPLGQIDFAGLTPMRRAQILAIGCDPPDGPSEAKRPRIPALPTRRRGHRRSLRGGEVRANHRVAVPVSAVDVVFRRLIALRPGGRVPRTAFEVLDARNDDQGGEGRRRRRQSRRSDTVADDRSARTVSFTAAVSGPG